MGLKPRAGGLSRGARFGILVNVVLICLLGLGIALGLVYGVKRLSYRHDLRIDVTEEQTYALDPLTEELVTSVEAPLRVTAVIGYDQGILQRVRDSRGEVRAHLLRDHYRPILGNAAARIGAAIREWEARSPHIEARVFLAWNETAEVQAFAREIGRAGPGDVLNRVILEQGRRVREVGLGEMLPDVYWGYFGRLPGERDDPPRRPRNFRVHEALTVALRQVLTGETQRVGLLTGAGGGFEPETSAWRALERMLAPEGFELVALPARELGRVPPDLDALLVATPKQALEPEALTAIEAYEAERGGRILLVPSVERPRDFQRLVEPYGVRLKEGLVYDPRLANPAARRPAALDHTGFWTSGHPIVASMTGRGIRLYLGRTGPMELTRDRAAGASAVGILAATNRSRIAPIERKPEGGFAADPNRARIPEGVPTLGAALERPLGVGGDEARLVVAVSDGLLEVEALERTFFYGNRDFLLNALRWLTDVETGIGMAPRERLRARVIDVRDVETPFTIVGVVGLPGLALLFGLVAFFTRRR